MTTQASGQVRFSVQNETASYANGSGQSASGKMEGASR